MNFLRLFVLTLLLGSLLLTTFPPQAKAFVTPPTEIEIHRVKIFHGLWDEGDWLTVVDYTVTGTESVSAPEALYSVCLQDQVLGIEACRGVPRYGRGVASVYLTESEAEGLGFDWADVVDYVVTLRGNPSEFDPAVYADGVTYVEYDVRTKDDLDLGLSKNRQRLCELLTEFIAPEAESDTGLDLLTDNGDINEDDGYTFFAEGIPGLGEICGECLATSVSYPDAPRYWAHTYIYPDSTVAIGSESGINPVLAGTAHVLVDWPFNIRDTRGIASSGSTGYVLCTEFDQDDDFWNWATITVFMTDDGAAPQGESAIITDFTSATGRFDFGTPMTVAVDSGDFLRIDYDDTYVWTNQTDGYDEFIFTLDSFSFPDDGDLKEISVHYDFSCEGDGFAYVRPVIYSGSDTLYGSWRNAPGGAGVYTEAERIEPDTLWTNDEVTNMMLGLRCYVNSGSDQCRIYVASVELQYETSNPEKDYAEELLGNTGNRLRTALENLGEWLGVPGMVASSLGVAFLYFALAGRIFVATGSPVAAVVLGFPFILTCVVVGLLQMYLVFIIIFTVVILFGITFILARF